MADDPGYTLSRHNFDTLRRVVRLVEGQPRSQPRLQRIPRQFQPSAGTKVYQALTGLKLRPTTLGRPEEFDSYEPVVLAVEIGGTSDLELRNLTHGVVKKLNETLSVLGATSGGIVAKDISQVAYDPAFLDIVEEAIGSRNGAVALRARFCAGYLPLGSVFVGNDSEALYGVGNQVYTAVIEEAVDGTTGYYVAALTSNQAAVDNETITEDDELTERIIVYDRFPLGLAFEADDVVQVAFLQQTWFDNDKVYFDDFWYYHSSSATYLPVFQLIGPPKPFIVRGVAQSLIAEDAVGNVVVYARSASDSYTSTGRVISALNDLDGEVPNGATVRCMPEMDGTIIRWAIIQSDCP